MAKLLYGLSVLPQRVAETPDPASDLLPPCMDETVETRGIRFEIA